MQVPLERRRKLPMLFRKEFVRTGEVDQPADTSCPRSTGSETPGSEGGREDAGSHETP